MAICVPEVGMFVGVGIGELAISVALENGITVGTSCAEDEAVEVVVGVIVGVDCDRDCTFVEDEACVEVDDCESGSISCCALVKPVVVGITVEVEVGTTVSGAIAKVGFTMGSSSLDGKQFSVFSIINQYTN